LLEERDGDSVGIGYSIKIYLKSMKKQIYCRKEIIVREFLFTPEEIDLDWQKYKTLLAVKQMLKPSGSRIESSPYQAKDEAKLSLAMKEQSEGITNKSWSLDQMVTGSKCLCFKSNYLISINVELN
jgi:hypothetical protein